MNKEIAICTVAFGPDYKGQQWRMIASLHHVFANYKLFRWTDEYPPASPTFDKSLYGFKVYAISQALSEGYKKIVWLDTACIVYGPLDYLFADGMPPVVAVRDENKLLQTISDKALKYYGNPDISILNLVGGSMYAFDFDKPGCQEVFDHWAKAEADGIFGTQVEQISEQINKHRHDESCMAMALHMNSIDPVTPAKAMYCTGRESVIIKKHFK